MSFTLKEFMTMPISVRNGFLEEVGKYEQAEKDYYDKLKTQTP